MRNSVSLVRLLLEAHVVRRYHHGATEVDDWLLFRGMLVPCGAGRAFATSILWRYGARLISLELTLGTLALLIFLDKAIFPKVRC